VKNDAIAFISSIAGAPSSRQLGRAAGGPRDSRPSTVRSLPVAART
jgi:hypothetical protein